MTARRHRQRILLTGLGPFPGVPVNASGELVTRLAVTARVGFPEHQVLADILPTEWEAAPRRLAGLLVATQPTIALHFGVSRAAEGFVIETEARNVAGDARDACGALPASACIIGGEGARLRATLPTGQIVGRLVSAGIPASASGDTGSYLCNTVLYHSLRHADKTSESTLVGFVHVPIEIGEHAGVLTWDQAVAGGMLIVRTCVETAGLTSAQRSSG